MQVNVRWIARAILLTALISCSAALAQGNELVVMRSVKASRVAGVVQDSTGFPLENVLVSSFDCGDGEFQGAIDFKPLEKVATDEKGRFDLKWPKARHVCLEFRTPGMDLLQIQIRKSLVVGGLKVKLRPGS